ncbi:permease-like cell division protein FtsX [Thiopseudomonas denitrificans]|uniref:Cell division protein FtsX n=1 Tax=Thiopseudomonas denitrificans TaxID=1501432 RepID=A0A4R6U0A3_9GAMM|nr:permease-like cell division protein FtsX [Thiopseudomonas denitrificans]TDQ37779.1 cell division protein FtsX [Thiopseudomonas denitrificans]
MSAQLTPDQPGKRIGATERHRVDSPPVEATEARVQLQAWLNSHRASFLDSAWRIVRQPFGSFFTCLVIAVALSLPMGLTLLLNNLNQLGASWQQAAQISVFFELKTTDRQAQALLADLQSHEGIAEVQWISREQALQDFSSFSGLGQVLQELPDNPLPSSLLITPLQIDPDGLQELVHSLENMPHVQQVQLDLQWVERLAAMLRLGERFIFALTLVLIAALLLVVGNTIRLHIENRRTEIEVIKLVGGTDGYVRRPFLYMGALYGVGGGCLAWLLLVWGFAWLNQSVTELASLYASDFRLAGVSLDDGFSLLIGAVLLGYIGAWLAVARHLRELLPS